MLRALITSLRFWLVAGALTGCVFAAPERVAEFLRLTLLSPARALDFLPFGRDEITTQVEQLSAENDLLKARLEAAAAPGATRATPTAVPGEIVFTETVPGAAVVARDPSPWGRTVLVNRGR
ncbi:MAG: hypothetical protein HY719_15695, partial [Planctomycetes bacterium]|nr:hypothetical protein [Planctomycetota bacterium]